MKILESAENYLETILVLEKRKGNVRAIDIVNELGFSKPSVSVAMKHFRENGYITVEDGRIRLTDSGRSIAESMYGRHLTLTGYLVSIGVDRETAERDACRIEHVISEETFRCIQKQAGIK